jgi:hypothetical protein
MICSISRASISSLEAAAPLPVEVVAVDDALPLLLDCW